ncbi:MAG: hypothetical protein BWY05_00809 [Euryarchaeota archaeon ADurb.Bin165]|nr:MAG: hypothetical protein BWY05_00809 [Euryarchaeota archaeon ADurb.Bin165]
MIRFGGVPIRVIIPPSCEPKASGSRRIDTGTRLDRAILIPTGIRRARAPTLFINADRVMTRPVRADTCKVGRFPTFIRAPAITSTTPAFCSPRLITRTAATVITAGFAKPENVWFQGTIPRIADIQRARRATMS